MNIPAQQHLLNAYSESNPFLVDVAKACHHGSSDFTVDFLKKVRPRVNVFSSGDNKSFDHPMADALGAAGRHARGDHPLLFCTELARAHTRAGIHYGLINARSNGTTLVMAQMKEQHGRTDVWDSYVVPWHGRFPHCSITRDQIENVLRDFNQLAKDEYGITVEELLADDDPIRLERLTGILVKQPFATSKFREQNDPVSETGAPTMWIWDAEKLRGGVSGAEKEYELLKKLCEPGSWNEGPNQASGLTWEQFEFEVNQERGLFKVAALYLKDRLNERETKTIAEYYTAEESEAVRRSLDLATILAQGAIVGPIMSAIGVPGLAVGLALYVADYGASRLFDRNLDRKGDHYK